MRDFNEEKWGFHPRIPAKRPEGFKHEACEMSFNKEQWKFNQEEMNWTERNTGFRQRKLEFTEI